MVGWIRHVHAMNSGLWRWMREEEDKMKGNNVPSNCTISYLRNVPSTLSTGCHISHSHRAAKCNPDLYQALNPLLDIKRVRLEPTSQLTGNFVNQLVVSQVLPILHDPDDARFCLMPPLLVHPVLCLLPLLSILNSCRYCTDLNLLQVGGEARVK